MIQCPRCYVDFNSGVNCPRILLSCGHTVCEKCLGELLERALKEQSIDENATERIFYCPECRMVHNHLPVSSFPKNLALLNINKEKELREDCESGSDKRGSGSAKTSTPDKSIKSSEDEVVPCSSHYKKVEAYCMMCRQVLCIDCILNDGHKNHEINSIEKAAGIEKSLFFDFLKRSIEIEDRIKTQSTDIENHFIMIRNQANKNKECITSIFNNVRKLINARESELKGKITSVLKEEEEYLDEKKDKMSQQLLTINEFKKRARIMDSESDIKLLQSSEIIYDISQKALEKQSPIVLKDPFVNVKEDIELMHICRMIDPSYNTTLNNKMLKNNKYSSGGYRPQTGRTRSKDGRNDSLKSNNLLKKSSNNVPVLSSIKGIAQSPTKVKNLDCNSNKITHSDVEIPNYTKPIHNAKKKKQNTIGNLYLTLKNQINIDDLEIPNKTIKAFQVQSNLNFENKLRSSVDAQKYKQERQKGLHDWRKQGTDEHYNEIIDSKAALISSKKDPHVMIKKSTSLYEARSKHKAERSKNEYLNRIDDPCDSNKDEGVEVGRVPRLNPTKSSPVNDYVIRNDEDIAFTIPSYRHSNDLKARGDNYDVPDNWEVSRIEQNSDVERSFKNEVRVLLPDEERKIQNYEIERRLEGLANEEDDEYFIKNKDGFVKKVPASPASEENFGSSMITYNKDSSKNDLSRMMITVDQYIYVISGYKNTTLTSVERLNMNKGIWQNVSEVNIGRTKFGAVSYKGEKIYIMGGKLLDGSRTDLIEEFDIRADKWSMSKLKLPSPRSGFCCVLINDKQLLIVGGNDGQVLDSMHLLNLSTGDWSELPPMTTKRDELAVAVGPDGKIYVIGGYGGINSACLKSVERFNLQTYEWEKVADLNQPRRALSAVSLPDGVYVIGGYNGSRYLGCMERYDESQNKWIKCAEMNSPRCTLSAVSSNDCQYIYAMGGFDGTYMDVVERYDHVHDCWDYVTPMMTTRFMHSSCIVNVIRK